MSLATKITVFRMILVPVFVFYAIRYGLSVQSGIPIESLRFIAVGTFTLAALSDGIDGWIARRFNQKTDLGAFLDPIADKALVLSAIITLSLVPWGIDDWRLPIWFITIVIARDVIILVGIRYLYSKQRKVLIRPHWIGKACTFSLFFVLGWIMLKLIPASPFYPCLIAGILTALSLIEYIRQGLGILREKTPQSS